MKQKHIKEGWSGADGIAAYNKVKLALGEMSGDEVLDIIWNYLSYEQLKKLYEWLEQDGYFDGLEEKRNIAAKLNNHIKRLCEMNENEPPVVYLDYLHREVDVCSTLEEFSEQFEDTPTKDLYDFVVKSYDFASDDEKPNANNRNEILEFVYEYCVAFADEME